LIIKGEQRVELRSRKNKDLTRVYRGVAAAGERVKADRAVVEGEIVALDAQGSPSFQALQHRGSHPAVGSSNRPKSIGNRAGQSRAELSIRW
jgi:ATP-dependent DNA ligase